jgi:hypothetical protein
VVGQVVELVVWFDGQCSWVDKVAVDVIQLVMEMSGSMLR